MRVLVTAGATEVPIDEVRSISNRFRGKTGCRIAQYFEAQGATVTLLASNPELVHNPPPSLRVVPFRTFDELASLMEQKIRNGKYDVVIHSVAVSDYRVSRVLDENFTELPKDGKISSRHPRLFIETVPTPKLRDSIRKWGFTGVLVSFKLEQNEEALELFLDTEFETAFDTFMKDSGTDILVANYMTPDGGSDHLQINLLFGFGTVTRENLPKTLHEEVIRACSRRRNR